VQIEVIFGSTLWQSQNSVGDGRFLRATTSFRSRQPSMPLARMPIERAFLSNGNWSCGATLSHFESVDWWHWSEALGARPFPPQSEPARDAMSQSSATHANAVRIMGRVGNDPSFAFGTNNMNGELLAFGSVLAINECQCQ
jgi:hypothetical protein